MRWLPLALWLAWLVGPGPASAQDLVPAGVAAYESGDFAAARAAFEEAERTEGLSRSELVRLLATRALLSFAEGQSEAMIRDLTALATLEPEYDLGPRAPPAVREALESARAGGGVLGIRVDGARTDGGARVSAEIEGDRAGLVRQLRVGARAGGPWIVSEAGAVSLRGRELSVIEYHAAATGPGGAVLVEQGSEAVPQRIVLPPRDEARSGDDGLAIGFGVAGAVIAAAAAVVIVLLVTGDQGERVDVPHVEWP